MADKIRSTKNAIDLQQLLAENELKLFRTGFFRKKTNVHIVQDHKNEYFALKTGGFDALQIELFEIAESMEKSLCFRVPAIRKQGKQGGQEWVLFEKIDGRPLNDFFDEKPEWCLDIFFKISQDYQRVIKELQITNSLDDLLSKGEEWLFSRLILWSEPIIKKGLIDFDEVQQLKRELGDLITKRGKNFFTFCHGNVIGDHVFVSGDGVPYLVDLAAVPRIGRGYHDFIRSIDFMILKSESVENLEKSIPIWVKKYLSDFDLDEVRLVFAFRAVGILWDMLSGVANDYIKGDEDEKIDLILKLVRRELF